MIRRLAPTHINFIWESHIHCHVVNRSQLLPPPALMIDTCDKENGDQTIINICHLPQVLPPITDHTAAGDFRGRPTHTTTKKMDSYPELTHLK